MSWGARGSSERSLDPPGSGDGVAAPSPGTLPPPLGLRLFYRGPPMKNPGQALVGVLRSTLPDPYGPLVYSSLTRLRSQSPTRQSTTPSAGKD